MGPISQCVRIGESRRPCGEVTEGLTALTAAAQGDHYEIIQLLLRHGHVVARPHRALCECYECVRVEGTHEVRPSLCLFVCLSSAHGSISRASISQDYWVDIKED